MKTRIWSRTRRKMYFQCPRKWYLTYGNQSKGEKRNPQIHQNEWNLMLRAIKSTLMDRLEDLKEGKHWSDRMVEFQMDDALLQHFERSGILVDENLISTLKMYALNRFHRLWRCSSIQQLVNRKHKQWYLFERTEPEIFEGITLYCTVLQISLFKSKIDGF